jgi:hypothetical protein
MAASVLCKQAKVEALKASAEQVAATQAARNTQKAEKKGMFHKFFFCILRWTLYHPKIPTNEKNHPQGR